MHMPLIIVIIWLPCFLLHVPNCESSVNSTYVVTIVAIVAIM